MKYTIVILLATTEKWLRLSRTERSSFFEKSIGPLIEKYKNFLSVKLFDSESLHARHTDFILIETTELEQYYFFWEEIRDSKIYTEPYFLVNDIIVGMQDGYREFEKTIQS